MARVKRRILAKRYAPIELISVAVSRVAVELRTRAESWPPRLKKVWPEMPQEASSVLREELAIALNELADIRVDFSDYDVSDIERDLDRVESLARDDTDDGG
ncbi:DNA packaging protein [Escherichia coli]